MIRWFGTPLSFLSSIIPCALLKYNGNERSHNPSILPTFACPSDSEEAKEEDDNGGGVGNMQMLEAMDGYGWVLKIVFTYPLKFPCAFYPS